MQINLVIFILSTAHLGYVVEFIGSACQDAQTTTGNDWTLNEDASILVYTSFGLVMGMLLLGTMLYSRVVTRGELHWPSEEGTTECTGFWLLFCCVPCRRRSFKEFQCCTSLEYCLTGLPRRIKWIKTVVRFIVNSTFRICCAPLGLILERVYTNRHYISV